MAAITNISTYRFAHLTELKPLRERLLGLCKEAGLRGTILLSTEGINLFVAGARASVDALVAEIERVPGLADLRPKYSESEEQPFTRMLVRIKKEIIAFGVEGIDPSQRTSPKLSARTLKQWLDEGRAVTLLDTRNDYEVRLGTFKGALVPGIDTFREFPEAVRRMPEAMKEQPIVMFCTGGIRCEKAGPFMEREGFRNVFQLDGGILKYFEECGSDHYEGECFVFDHRVGVDPSLRETTTAICYECQTPLTNEDQADARFVPGESCPYCYKTTAQQMAEAIVKREARIRKIVTPLPGSAPYDNRRPLNVGAAYEGSTLIEWLTGIFPHMGPVEWRERCANERVRDEAGELATPERRVRAGERFFHLLPGTVEPDVRADLRVLHEDTALVVLHKPAPLPMHPSGRFNRNTLQHILEEAYAPQKLRAAHRLDANTTGVVVCTRSRHFATLLQPQFTRGEVEKIYLVRVAGHPAEDAFACDAAITDEPGAMGTRTVDEEGQAAHTEFRVLRRDGDGTALLEARPLTGRTNQIRVHLWQLGLPVCGDPAYLLARQLGTTQTLTLSAPPLCLHAWRITFTHPLTKERVTFTAEPPAWAL